MTKQYNPKTGARGIEWCDETRNIFGGCLHRCRWEMPNGEVAKCYAEELAENGLAKRGYWKGFEHHYYRGNPGSLAVGKTPLLIFMDSMSDLFGHWVPEDQLHNVLKIMGQAPHHTYQSLTKAPGRILKFQDDLPANLWVGVSSAPDFMLGHKLTRRQQEAYIQRALSVLGTIKQETGNIVFMSIEPLSWDMAYLFKDHPLDWAIIGAASDGPRYFQPEPGDVRNLLHIFDQRGTPVFFKGNIRKCVDGNALGRWREDFPAYYRDGSPIPAVVQRQENALERGWTPNEHLSDAHRPVKQLSLLARFI